MGLESKNVNNNAVSQYLDKLKSGLGVLVVCIIVIELFMFVFGQSGEMASSLIWSWMPERWLYDKPYFLRHVVSPTAFNIATYVLFKLADEHCKSIIARQIVTAVEVDLLAVCYVFSHYGMIYLSVIFIYPTLITLVFDRRINIIVAVVCIVEILLNFVYQQSIRNDYYNVFIVSTNLAIFTMTYIVAISLRKVFMKMIEDTNTLYEEANTDKLTGLNNRNALAHFSRTAGLKSIAFIDVDHFKGVNDTYGHEMGDNVLQQTAICLSTAVQDDDNTFVFRLGGDEFLVLSKENKYTLATELVEMKNNFTEICSSLYQINVTLSVGVISYDSSLDLQSAVNNSDAAMYKSKESGRNSVTIV